MLNTQIPTTGTPTATNGNNNKITTSYLDNGIITAQNNGKITVSQTTLPTHELINLKDTLGNLTTAFDDIATVVSMLLNGNFHKYQQESLLRLLQSHAFDYMELCENTADKLKECLGGAK